MFSRCGPFVLVLLLACGAPAPHAVTPPVPAVPRLKAPKPIDPSARGAAYLTAVALQLQPGWGQFLDDCRLRLPADHPLNNMALAATAEIAIDASGSAAVIHLDTSGSADFDRAVTDAIVDARRFPQPSTELLSDDNKVHLRWLFARNDRQAGPATASVLDVEWPLERVVPGLIAHREIARAARRIARDKGDPLRATFVTDLMVEVLHEALDGTDDAARRAAVVAVARAHVSGLLHDVEAQFATTSDAVMQLDILETLIAAHDVAVVDELLTRLRAAFRERRKVYVELYALGLGRLEWTKQLGEILQEVIEDPNSTPTFRALAVTSLAYTPELATKLLPSVEGKDIAERVASCTAASGAALSVAAPRLARGLRDGDASVREACLDSFTDHFRTAPNDKRLRGLVPRVRELAADRDAAVRARAALALMAADPIRRQAALNDTDRGVRAAYAIALAGRLDSPELADDANALIEDRDANVRAAAWTALAAAPTKLRDATAPVRAAGDPSADVRRAVIPAISDAAVLQKLAAGDESSDVRTEALAQLVKVRGRPAMEKDLLERIAAAPPASVERVRVALAWLLAK